mmetsp:Transcript_137402/g.342727  ORF Transcript_137402/g.342727 Transcript_137402/m.342727 type:complete len:196 (+) Transcript_137402:100-687(+)
MTRSTSTCSFSFLETESCRRSSSVAFVALLLAAVAASCPVGAARLPEAEHFHSTSTAPLGAQVADERAPTHAADDRPAPQPCRLQDVPGRLSGPAPPTPLDDDVEGGRGADSASVGVAEAPAVSGVAAPQAFAEPLQTRVSYLEGPVWQDLRLLFSFGMGIACVHVAETLRGDPEREEVQHEVRRTKFEMYPYAL